MASESGEGLASEKKRELLQSYGLNPDEFLSDPSPKVSLHWVELCAHCLLVSSVSSKLRNTRLVLEIVLIASFSVTRSQPSAVLHFFEHYLIKNLEIIYSLF